MLLQTAHPTKGKALSPWATSATPGAEINPSSAGTGHQAAAARVRAVPYNSEQAFTESKALAQVLSCPGQTQRQHSQGACELNSIALILLLSGMMEDEEQDGRLLAWMLGSPGRAVAFCWE